SRLLELTDELLEVDLAATARRLDADIRIDDQHALDVLRQSLEEAKKSRGLASVDTVVEAAPAGLAQPQEGRSPAAPSADRSTSRVPGPCRAPSRCAAAACRGAARSRAHPYRRSGS